MQTRTPSEFEQLMQQEQERMSSGAVSAVVLEVTSNGVLADAGFKSNCLIPILEFEDEPMPQVGDFIACALVNIDHQGQGTLLSREIARRLTGAHAMREALQSNETVMAKVIGVNKGGLMVSLMGCKGFMPKSLARGFDLRSAQINDIIPCKVDKCDNQGLKVILAYAPTQVESANNSTGRSKADELSDLHEGDLVHAEVKSITQYGAFCSFGALSGLLHISQISHDRVENIENELAIGQIVEVKVISIDREKGRISLSRKVLLQRPARRDEQQTEAHAQ